jgi:hypothetical protein
VSQPELMCDSPFGMYLPIASFALAVGGLAVRFSVRSGPAKQLIIAVLSFLALSSAFQWHQDWLRTRQVRATGNEIIGVVGNDKLTYEDIIAKLRLPDSRLVSAAIELLISEERLGSEAVTILDKADRLFRLRLYFVRSP